MVSRFLSLGLEMTCSLSAIKTTTSGCSRRAPSKRAHVRVCLDSTFSTLPLLTTIATEVLHELEARKGPSSFATSPSASTGVVTSSCLCVCVCARACECVRVRVRVSRCVCVCVKASTLKNGCICAVLHFRSSRRQIPRAKTPA